MGAEDEERERREALSRKLSRLLRHRLGANGLLPTPDGYVALERVLALQMFEGVAAADVEAVVRACPKQRFGVKDGAGGQRLIRANQGHTDTAVVLDDEAMLERIEPAPGDGMLAVHGTYRAAWDSIRAQGLRRMARRHVHLAAGLPEEGGVISGMRRSCKVAIWVDVAAATAAGIPFYRSQNSVILSPGCGSDGTIPPSFFARATDLRTGEELALGATSEA